MKSIDISNAAALWKTFQETAHLNDMEYDAELKEAIRLSLGAESEEQMMLSLQNNDISVEKLLYAILRAAEPFSVMLSDLLRMFERASAQMSSTNLQMRFDFDKDKPPLNFDLESFRKTVRSISRRIVRQNIRVVQDPWTLIHIFEQKCNTHVVPKPCSAQICQWLDEYYNKDIWPDFLPCAPKTGVDALDDMVGMIWEMVESAINYYRQAYVPEKGRIQSHLEECHRRKDDSIWWIETDYWVGHLIKTITGVLEYLCAASESDRVKMANALTLALQDFFNSCAVDKIEVTELAENLEDLLILPYWERRYELYSAWILAQITDGLRDTGISYHAVSGVLSFSFQKTLMATCEKLSPPLEIWAELRTKSTAPMKGAGRKMNIQPDYTLAVHNAAIPENTAAVVECKQYKRSNRQNFLSAILDYANGRPEGSVFLVNYGPVSKNLLSGESQRLRERAFPYGCVRPHTANADAFRKKLKEAVCEYYRARAISDGRFFYPWTAPGAPCSITLTWGRSPKDLDLGLHIEHPDGTGSAVDFLTPGHLGEAPYAQLDCDCQNGFGRETIRIERWLDADYRIVVNNYSGEGEVDGDIEVRVSCGRDSYSLICTKPWKAPFMWHVIRLKSSGFQVVHQFARLDPDRST